MSPNAPYIALTAATAAWTTSDLGQFEVSGPDAGAFVNRVATADLSALPSGRFVHALLLRDDATILARVTVYRFDEMVMLLVDGAARAEAWQYLVQRKRGTVRLRDISDYVAVIAVRGPRTVAQLTTELFPMPQRSGDISRARLGNIDVFAARTTADGPDGFDLYCRGRDLPTLGDTLARLGVALVDVDTWHIVRLELGVARLGIEIDPSDTPVEAALESLVVQHKGAAFPGEVAYAERLRTGPLRKLVGFTVAGSDAPPVGATVHAAGRAVDRIRSIGTSPRFGIIGMTAVPLGADAVGTPLVIGSNGQEWQAVVAKVPFVRAEL
jgi:aminomethyltransferase